MFSLGFGKESVGGGMTRSPSRMPQARCQQFLRSRFHSPVPVSPFTGLVIARVSNPKDDAANLADSNAKYAQYTYKVLLNYF
jgi:hypothetical protein